MPDPLISLLIALVIVLLLAALFWPRVGLYQRWQRQRRISARVLREDALKHIHRAERYGRSPTMQSLAGALRINVNEAAHVLGEMEQAGLIRVSNGDFALTAEGNASALHIIRAHRLWERYLADETGYEETEWHEQAEHLEHSLPLAEVEALAARLGHPTHDPHGDPIPTAGGEWVQHGGVPLSSLEANAVGRIVHIEDEPELVYSQLVAEGLHPGMEVQVVERSARSIRFWGDGDEHVLAPLLAANVSVRPRPPHTAHGMTESGVRLAQLRPGESAVVTAMSRTCRASERRRLMDLGILPGARIEASFASPGGDPTAYLVRDTLIALRSEQAAMISIERPQHPAHNSP